MLSEPQRGCNSLPHDCVCSEAHLSGPTYVVDSSSTTIVVAKVVEVLGILGGVDGCVEVEVVVRGCVSASPR